MHLAHYTNTKPILRQTKNHILMPVMRHNTQKLILWSDYPNFQVCWLLHSKVNSIFLILPNVILYTIYYIFFDIKDHLNYFYKVRFSQNTVFLLLIFNATKWLLMYNIAFLHERRNPPFPQSTSTFV